MDNEVWRPVIIKDFENLYEVSNKGRVRSKDRYIERKYIGYWKLGRILRPRKNKQNYLRVGLYNNSKSLDQYIHILVLSAFIGPRPDNMETFHKDNNRQNNCLENLKWATHKENKDYQFVYKTTTYGEKNPGSKLYTEQVIEILKSQGYKSARELASYYKVDRRAIQDIWNRKLWKHINLEIEVVS